MIRNVGYENFLVSDVLEKLCRYYWLSSFLPFKLDRKIPWWKFEGNFDFE